jgi:hypothetical protein
MDGICDAGSVLAIDHDRLFKELLTTFFVEFLELFFPVLAETLERDSIEFLSQEHFANLLDGEEYRVDIVAKARFKGSETFFLIHIEHQSTAPSTFPVRFFRYYSALFEKHGLPIYPIVIYSHDRPRKVQPHVYRVAFPDGEVLRFRYRVVQLNRLPWRKFVKTHNPVASALMSRMKIAPLDRPKVKAECLRLMLTLRLDRARMKLITAFVDSYLRLNEREEKVFQRTIDAKVPRRQKEEIVEIITSWEEKGLKKGVEQGVEQGVELGRAKLRKILCEMLESRFGPLEHSVAARINRIGSMDQLGDLVLRAGAAGSLRELGL